MLGGTTLRVLNLEDQQVSTGFVARMSSDSQMLSLRTISRSSTCRYGSHSSQVLADARQIYPVPWQNNMGRSKDEHLVKLVAVQVYSCIW